MVQRRARVREAEEVVFIGAGSRPQEDTARVGGGLLRITHGTAPYLPARLNSAV